ncbi:plasma membrane Ca2+ ATPase [Plasmodium gonderi]|uniref:Plasma membrane Ca2+ ATPase n=1 Tax=Plasmodium gonderi TaxID=77519 RepID=A0A1Y1JLI5_PLAGO|nr:plasma membrane Ca2+ ATPase [Plasmodium gonderi]GAW82087.1 plasma membrane Ca2+ ATPase [Plasmodium gonderi]
MNNEITKSLFPYDAKFFKGIFDKYMKNEDYSEDLKNVRSSNNLMQEVISNENGLIFYLEENCDETFLKQCKLKFFRKVLKHVNGMEEKEKSLSHEGISIDVKETKQNDVLENKKNEQSMNKADINKERGDKDKNKKPKELLDYFIFNKKINVINSYRIYCYCSNIIQSLPSLTYLSVIKIYLENYPLKVFLSCVYFYTFVTYVCDRNNLLEFLESLFFSLIVTIGCLALAGVHYIKENRINLITSKLNNFRENYICRNFIKNNIDNKMKLTNFESRKTVEIKKYSKYFFLKSFLNRINAELLDYESFKADKNSSYVQEHFKDIIPNEYSGINLKSKSINKSSEMVNEVDNNEIISKEDLTLNSRKSKDANKEGEETSALRNNIISSRVNVEEGIFPDKRNKTSSKVLDNNKKNGISTEKYDVDRGGKGDMKKQVVLNDEVDREKKYSEDILRISIGEEEGRKNSTEMTNGKKKKNLVNYILYENNIYSINSKNILVGDIVYLFKGDVIPADGILIKCNDLVVDESNILKSAKSQKKKISLDEYLYYSEKSRKRKLSVNELKKKKLNYFEILNLKVKANLKRLSREESKVQENSNLVDGKDGGGEESDDEKLKKLSLSGSNNKRVENLYNKGEKNNSKNRLSTNCNFGKMFEYSPLVLSESIVRNGTGIMITTCVSKNKQMFHHTIKDVEENTELELIINSFAKNVVIIIIFYCILCILFIFIHFLITIVENNMQTYAYNLLIFLLNCIIIEILKYLLLSIDQMPLLLQNCIALNSRQIMRENFLIKRKNTFEKILFTNIIYIDIERYIKYKCIYFFYNKEFSFSFDSSVKPELSSPKQEFINLSQNKERQIEMTKNLFFKLLIHSILTTSNLYHYNENFLHIDMSLLKLVKIFQINIEDYFIPKKHIFRVISSNQDFIISFVFSKNSYLPQQHIVKGEKNKEINEQVKYGRENLNVLRIFIRGRLNLVFPKCRQYLDGDTLRMDIDELKEKVEKVEKENHESVICFAYKEIVLSENEKDMLFQYDDDSDYAFDNKEMNKNIDETYLKYAEMNDYICISILAFEETLSKYFYFDYKMLEGNDMCVKLFTKNSILKTKKLFRYFPDFFESLKLYNAKIQGNEDSSNLNYHNEDGDRFGIHQQGKNSNNSKEEEKKNMKKNVQAAPQESSDRNDYNETYLENSEDLQNYKLKGNKKKFPSNKCRSEVLNLKQCADSMVTNLSSENENKKNNLEFLLNNNIFYNCGSKELSSLLKISSYYGKSAVVTNESNVMCEERLCNIRICDDRCKGENKEKSDIIILNKSLHDFIKLKNFSNSILTNIQLFIEHNITLYVCMVIFSTVCTLVNGLEFLSTIQILYIYFIKNVIFHYLSCYRKSSLSTGGKKKKQSYDFFKEKDINDMISSILSKTIILFIIFFFGHVFIPESKWDFVTEDLRNVFEFSEFSYLTDRQQSGYYHTIRSCIRFKKNLANLKIQDEINVQNDYRYMTEWENYISPGRHDTILFNVFFLFFFFSYIHIYLKTFLREIHVYLEKHKGIQNERYKSYIIPLLHNERTDKKILSLHIRNFMNELKEEQMSANLVHTKNSKQLLKGINNEQSKSSETDTNTNEKMGNDSNSNDSQKGFFISTIVKQMKNKSNLVNMNINMMLLKLVGENYMTFVIFLLILMLHIFVIEFGSVFFNLHIHGLTLIQWVFCFACCGLDIIIYFIICRLGLFLLPSSAFKTFQNLYEPREKSVFDTLNDYKRSYMSQRYKYDLKV